MFLFDHTVLAAFCFIMTIVVKIHEGVKPFINLKDHVTAIAAITAGGTTFWNIDFPSVSSNAISAVSGLDIYLNLINKHLLSTSFYGIRTVHLISSSRCWIVTSQSIFSIVCIQSCTSGTLPMTANYN